MHSNRLFDLMTGRVLAIGLVIVAVNCWIASPVLAAESITYNKHIAPILWTNCAGCHRPGEVGPFSLLNFQDAAKRAEFLVDVTASRRMPPWKAEQGYGQFHDARLLSDEQIALIAQWAETGAPEGDANDLPPAPKFPEGWQLGEPDIVVKMEKPFTVPASGNDVYRCFVLPLELSQNRTVAAVEFRPGNPKIVHHAIFYLDSRGAARRRDGEDGQPGYSSFGGPGILPTGGLGGWAPGTMPRRLPEGTGKFLRKGSDLVLQVHYHPSGKEETDQSTVGIHFTEKPAEKLVIGVALRTRQLHIPAGEKHHEVSAQSAVLPCTVRGLTIFPHMHMIGHQMKVWAEAPDGVQTPLIWIKDWDFNWQGAYYYEEPVTLVKGSVIKLTAVYDNSADNPRNPSKPPRDVHWGEQTTDEMGICSVSVVTDTLAELRLVARMRGNELGTILDGGIADEDLDDQASQKFAKLVPPSGLLIPDKYQQALAPFDTDGDGRMTIVEIDAMPVFIRNRVREAVLERLGK